jgi:heme-degrading monooxygenase HmoA
MISRIWRGWTKRANANAYDVLLRNEIFPGILARNIRGFRRIELFRAPDGDDVEFVTVMWFDTIEAVKAFAGEDYEAAVVPERARALLARYDAKSRHYNVRELHEAPEPPPVAGA